MPLIGYYLGEVRFEHVPLKAGNIQIPSERNYGWKDQSEITKQVIHHWASQEIPDWITRGKTKPARIILAKLAQQQDIEEVNAYLQKQKPRGKSGSTWLLHPEGDYDFILTILTAILFLFGEKPELLYPETTQHLFSTLLIEEGGEYRIKVPRSLGLVNDTENHYLMTEGSRYLKNRWLQFHGNSNPKFNNIQNGLEKWLLGYLKELQEAGLYEFNSVPYQRFTLTALMNLEAFASDTVRQTARTVLDRLNWKYAIGSLKFRRYPPFRRQLRNAGITSLNGDYHTALMKVWMSRTEESASLNSVCPAMSFPHAFSGNLQSKINGFLHRRHSLRSLKDCDRRECLWYRNDRKKMIFGQTLNNVTQSGINRALWGCLLSYQLPDQIVDWIKNKPSQYFIKMGHGVKASPEIYSGGPGYLLSAGGVHRGWRSLIVARPITLLVDDEAQNLDEVIHLAGPGENFTKWNNTGVYKNFACAAGPVHVPKTWESVNKNDLWSIYSKYDSLYIAVHSREDLGIICLFQKNETEQLLEKITESNCNQKVLYHKFQFPDGKSITYDVFPPKNKWVIISYDNKRLNRNFDFWALIDGEL